MLASVPAMGLLAPQPAERLERVSGQLLFGGHAYCSWQAPARTPYLRREQQPGKQGHRGGRPSDNFLR